MAIGQSGCGGGPATAGRRWRRALLRAAVTILVGAGGGWAAAAGVVEPPPPDFTVTPANPQIGEEVTISVSDGTVHWWELGGRSCDGQGPKINCLTFCDAWQTFTWTWDSGGTKTVILHTVEGVDVTHDVEVQFFGACGTGCVYDVAPPTVAMDALGGEAQVTVVTGAECFWEATTQESWIHIDGPSTRSGSATVTLTVDANETLVRSGTMAIAGQTVIVEQAAGGARFSVSEIRPEIGAPVQLTVTQGTPIRWELGGPGCGVQVTSFDCSDTPAGCASMVWSYVSAGPKTIRLTTQTGATVQVITVQSAGACPGACTFAVSPQTVTAGAESGGFTAQVVAPSGCLWTAESDVSWVHVTSGITGAGDGASMFVIDANTGGARSGTVRVAGVTVPVQQAAAAGQVEWLLVPGAAHVRGFQGTLWRSDMWIHNPNTSAAQVTVRFLRADTDNGGVATAPPLATATVPARGTVRLADVLGAVGGDVTGALWVEPPAGLARSLVVTSRTYNQTPAGTLGQFVPAMSDPETPVNGLVLTGLQHNAASRTNVGLVNASATATAGVLLHVMDGTGAEVGTYTAGLHPYGMTQVDKLVEKLDPPLESLDRFTVLIDFLDTQGHATSLPVRAYASVVDNVTGDPTMLVPGADPVAHQLLPGVAHIKGSNNSLWRTDVSLYNASSQSVGVQATYVADAGWTRSVGMTIFAGELRRLDNVLAGPGFDVTGDSKGYLQLDSSDAPPVVVGRTYTDAGGGGTYGQALVTGSAAAAAGPGETVYLPGLTVDSSFRTNAALLNADGANASTALLRLWSADGTLLAEHRQTLAAGRFLQKKLGDLLGFSGDVADATLEITGETGAGFLVYATVVDNGTNDATLVPAQMD